MDPRHNGGADGSRGASAGRKPLRSHRTNLAQQILDTLRPRASTTSVPSLSSSATASSPSSSSPTPPSRRAIFGSRFTSSRLAGIAPHTSALAPAVVTEGGQGRLEDASTQPLAEITAVPKLRSPAAVRDVLSRLRKPMPLAQPMRDTVVTHRCGLVRSLVVALREGDVNFFDIDPSVSTGTGVGLGIGLSAESASSGRQGQALGLGLFASPVSSLTSSLDAHLLGSEGHPSSSTAFPASAPSTTSGTTTPATGGTSAKPTLADIFQICIFLLSIDQPLVLRTEACDLLAACLDVLHSRVAAGRTSTSASDPSASSPAAGAVGAEIGAAGIQSEAEDLVDLRAGGMGIGGGEKGIGAIDKALFYRLVCDLRQLDPFASTPAQMAGAPSTPRGDDELAEEGEGEGSKSKGRDDGGGRERPRDQAAEWDDRALVTPALAFLLPPRLRALSSLSRNGRDIVALRGIVPLLVDWLGWTWEDVREARRLIRIRKKREAMEKAARPTSGEASRGRTNDSSSRRPATNNTTSGLGSISVPVSRKPSSSPSPGPHSTARPQQQQPPSSRASHQRHGFQISASSLEDMLAGSSSSQVVSSPATASSTQPSHATFVSASGGSTSIPSTSSPTVASPSPSAVGAFPQRGSAASLTSAPSTAKFIAGGGDDSIPTFTLGNYAEGHPDASPSTASAAYGHYYFLPPGESASGATGSGGAGKGLGLQTPEERTMHSIFSLLTSILKFSFARIEPAEIEVALEWLADAVLLRVSGEGIGEEGEEGWETGEGGDGEGWAGAESAVRAGGEQGGEEGANVVGEAGEDELGRRRSSARNSLDAPSGKAKRDAEREKERWKRKNRKKEKEILTDGYDYYGIEDFLGHKRADGSSLSPSPEDTPRPSGYTTPQMAPPAASSKTAPVSSSNESPSQAALPDRRSNIPRLVRGAELYDSDVRAIMTLLDAVLRYGFVPPTSVPDVVEVLCRVIGYHKAAAADLTSGMMPLSSSEPQGEAHLAALVAQSGEDDWTLWGWSLMRNLLKSHVANAVLRAVRAVLILPPPTSMPSSVPAGAAGQGEESPEGERTEDLAVLLGAIVCLRRSLAYVAENQAVKQRLSSIMATGGGVRGDKPVPSGGVGGAAATEDALSPSLSLPLILPALRDALRRQSDVLDYEVVGLVSDILPSDVTLPGSGSTGPSVSTKSLAADRLSHDDWNALIDLASVAKRHVQGWNADGKTRAASDFPFNLAAAREDSGSAGDLGRQGVKGTQATIETRPTSVRQNATVSPVVQALIAVLSKLRLDAPVPSFASAGAGSTETSLPSPAGELKGEVTSVSSAKALPWTPKLATLLLSLAPMLPEKMVLDLIQYHETQHLCLPCTPRWIQNMRALLAAFYYASPVGPSEEEEKKQQQHQRGRSDLPAVPSPKSNPEARRRLVELIFLHVSYAVRDLPAYRAVLVREILLPMAESSLVSETDEAIDGRMRATLVDAAVLSGLEMRGSDGQVTVKPADEMGEERSFQRIRTLLGHMARNCDCGPAPPTAASQNYPGSPPHSPQNAQPPAGASSTSTHGSSLPSSTSPSGSGAHPSMMSLLQPTTSSSTTSGSTTPARDRQATAPSTAGATSTFTGWGTLPASGGPAASWHAISQSILQSTHANHRANCKALEAVLDLIAIFNRLAFTPPWPSFTSAGGDYSSDREMWKARARLKCAAIFRDLLSLLRPGPTPAGYDPMRADISPAETSGPSFASKQSTGPSPSPRARLAILQWLVRFRTDNDHKIYLVKETDSLISSSASLFFRNKDDAAASGQQQSSQEPTSTAPAAPAKTLLTPGGRPEVPRLSRPMQRRASVGGARWGMGDTGPSDLADARGRGGRRDSPSRGLDRGRSASRSRRTAVVQEALWGVPETLPFELPTVLRRSEAIFSYDPHERSDPDPPSPMPISEYVASINAIIAHERDWELLSYLLCHLPHQLGNKHLFCGPKARRAIGDLRSLLCNSVLQQKLAPHVILPEDVKKTDVYAVAYETLTTLISYRRIFTKGEQDEMVEAFISGLSWSTNTAKPCVSALTIACYELGPSVTKVLADPLIIKLSQIMSSMTMSVRILELIATVGQIPSLYSNFTEADYKRVFGISLQYIQYHSSPAAVNREDFRSSPANFALSQYVMIMAYYNIVLWFTAIKLNDRHKHVPHITRGLLLANEGKKSLDEQTEVCFDMLARFTHSSADPKPKRSFINDLVMNPDISVRGPAHVPGKGAGTSEDKRASKTWLMGKGLVTITTLKKQGWVELLVRRPSGTMGMLCKLENVPVVETPDEESDTMALPAALMMHRDPDVMADPVLRAPDLPSLGCEEESEAVETGTSDAPAGHDRHQNLDRIRGRHLIGMTRFGLGKRARSNSFSGSISPSRHPGREPPGPYRQPTSPVLAAFDRDHKTEAVTAEEQQQLQEHAGTDEQITTDTATMSPARQDIMDSVFATRKAPAQMGRGRSGSTAATRAVSTFSRPPMEISVDPAFVALQLSSYPDIALERAPLLLPNEPATDRMLKAMDLTPVVDFHKIGVLYVGPGQKLERDILGNRHGSPSYTRFLSGLGRLIRLKGSDEFYTGGLDQHGDEHGKYAYAWWDDISQIIYHTATLMPNRAEDPSHAAKKALIGNDWVHVVFNESGHDYEFGTIPSQFNFVNIVISPHSVGGPALVSLGPDESTFYRVLLQRRPDMPEFGPIGEFKLVSATALPHLIRHLSLHANLISQVFLETGMEMTEYVSNWRQRLRIINRCRDRLEGARKTRVLDAHESGLIDLEPTTDRHDFVGIF